MRKTVNVVGIGKRRKGTSRPGNSYDFVPLAITYEDPSFGGVRACEVNCDTPEFEQRVIAVGDILEVFMHQQNFQMKLDGII